MSAKVTKQRIDNESAKAALLALVSDFDAAFELEVLDEWVQAVSSLAEYIACRGTPVEQD